MRQIFDTIHNSQSGISHNSLVKINREEAITYEVVQDLMASKMNVAYVEKDSAEDRLRLIISNVIITADIVKVM